MMEEAAEAVAAIRIFKETGNAENLREELGDQLGKGIADILVLTVHLYGIASGLITRLAQGNDVRPFHFFKAYGAATAQSPAI